MLIANSRVEAQIAAKKAKAAKAGRSVEEREPHHTGMFFRSLTHGRS